MIMKVTVSSQEATVKAELEESKSTKQITSSINDGISDFWHAFLSALLSMASFLIFAIWFLTSIVLPFGKTFITGVMSILTIVSSSSEINHVITRNYEESNHKTSLVGKIWTAFPRLEVAQFFLHCGVIVTTLSIFVFNFTLYLHPPFQIIFIYVSKLATTTNILILPNKPIEGPKIRTVTIRLYRGMQRE